MEVARARATSQAAAYAGLSLATVGWAAGFVAGKFALGEMTPLPVAAWRYAVAATILLPFALRQRPAGGLGRAARPLALMVLCGGVAYPWLFLAALSRTTATNTALLIALNPVLTLLFSPLVGERVDRRRLGGVLVALLGAATVITRGDLGHVAALSLNSGDLVALAAAAAWAMFNLTSRNVVGLLTPAFTNCVIYAIGGVALYVLGGADRPWAQLAAATPTAVGGIVVMAVLSSVIAGQFFLIGVRTVGVGRTVVFVYLVPVLTAVMSITLLGERFEAAQAAGGAAVLAGVYWTTRGVGP
jgi:drug/metabolite transporter (DMT)-like permease